MTLRVHWLEPVAENRLEALRSRLEGGIEVSAGAGLPDPASFDILISGAPEVEALAASPNLRAVIVPWAGVQPATRERLREFERVSLHNLHHNAAPTAELALALLFAAAKFIVPFDRQLRANDWSPRYEPSPALLLEGKSILILGYGAIGERVGAVCEALGMQVTGVRRSPQKTAGGEIEVYGLEALQTLLKRSQVLVICLPGTPETQGLIGTQELQSMPPGSILVNVGRGAVVEQAALYQALRDGPLLAAGLDVWYNYPDGNEGPWIAAPASFPFHELDNVVMSPHRGGASSDSKDLQIEHLARLLNTAAQGKPIPNRVDLKAGY